MRRTLYFVKKVYNIIVNCQVCRSIEPAAVKWRKEHLEVESAW